MSNRTLFWMAMIILGAMGVLFLVNMVAFLKGPPPEQYISHNEVRGMAVEYKDKLYTLNFDQQNQVIGWLNSAIPVDEAVVEGEVDVERIIIYRFKQPEIELKPVTYKDGILIFSATDWSVDLLRETSEGKLKQMLQESYAD